MYIKQERVLYCDKILRYKLRVVGFFCLIFFSSFVYVYSYCAGKKSVCFGKFYSIVIDLKLKLFDNVETKLRVLKRNGVACLTA